MSLCRLISLLMTVSQFLIIPVISSAEEYSHPGYLDDVREERFQVTKEIIITPYSEPDRVSVIDRIFTEKMTKEFSQEFRHRFGYTEFEQLEFTSNRMVESTDSGRQIQFEEYLDKQESFGKYMAKELAEYHVDSYLKGHKTTRKVYEAKEAISNIQVQTKAGYKFRIKYKITTNRVRFALEKPGEKFHKSVDLKLNGDDTTMRLSYDLTKTLLLGTDYDISNEIFSLRGEKRLSPTLSTSVTGQSYSQNVGNTPKQNRVLLGLRWND